MTSKDIRERFEEAVAFEHGLSGHKGLLGYAIVNQIMAAYDLATHSLITHAMQQIEEAHGDDRFLFKSEIYTILQSLLPEQNIKK